MDIRRSLENEKLEKYQARGKDVEIVEWLLLINIIIIYQNECLILNIPLGIYLDLVSYSQYPLGALAHKDY